MEPLLPERSGAPCAVAPQRRDWDLLLTAETHNFPCAVAPYPGARAASLPSSLLEAAATTHFGTCTFFPQFCAQTSM